MPTEEQLKQAAEDEKPTALLTHLVELRKRLIQCLLAVGLIFLVLFYFSNDLYAFLAQPIMQALPTDSSMIATGIATPFLTPLKLTVVLSIFIAIPLILHHIWAFISPGLYRREKRLAFPLLLSSVLLFYLGMAFAYFIVFPLVFNFFSYVVPEGVKVMPDIGQYLDFTLKLFFAFGAAFEVPVVTILLIWSGVVSTAQLSRYRPYVIVAAFVLGMLLTPPDVISQILLALPIWFLFETGIFCARFFKPQIS